MLLYWSELIYWNNISTLQDVVSQPICLNSRIKYNKDVLYAPRCIQHGTMLTADILIADLKIPTLTQFNVKCNLK